MEIIQVEDADLQAIEGDRRRTFQAISHPLNASVILNDIQANQRKRVIVICNTVSQAQGLFQVSKAYYPARGLKHSNAMSSQCVFLLFPKLITPPSSQERITSCLALVKSKRMEIAYNIEHYFKAISNANSIIY
ncbi:hypothetical protein [Nostoc sp.]|uniref:hypothetical protein n=1 Tax=Nostoc sp. TaxID=1180 RepID=UPI002FF7F750